MGANRHQVSRAHTAPLYQKLKRTEQNAVQFEHVEGLITTTLAPGHRDLFSPPFFNFWHGNSPKSVLDAIRRMKSILVDAGPFDGAFGFSEGGAVLLSTLMQDKIHCFGLRFIVLIAPTPPFDLSGERRLDISQTERPIVEIRTIFITGEHDQLRPLTELTQGLLSRDKTTVLEWTGAHAVPNSGESSLWAKVVAELQIINAE